jgi:lysyl-tRNA synthetase class 2
VLEVETPVLSHFANPDPNIESFSTVPAMDSPASFFLHTSPEFAMKRLLAAGCGPIYQLGKVFRRGESGGRHNPEFTLLEWYRPGFGYDDLIAEVGQLIETVGVVGVSEKLTYAEAFHRYAGIDVNVSDKRQLQIAAERLGIAVSDSLSGLDVQSWRDLILSFVVEPRLGQHRPTFLTDFPLEAASLAKIKPGNPPVAARFELFIRGVEIANGYEEVIDVAEQQQRWQADLATRARREQELNPVDCRLLAAMNSGIPPSSGVALGIDRLLMCLLPVANIDDCVAFPSRIA